MCGTLFVSVGKLTVSFSGFFPYETVSSYIINAGLKLAVLFWDTITGSPVPLGTELKDKVGTNNLMMQRQILH